MSELIIFNFELILPALLRNSVPWQINLTFLME